MSTEIKQISIKDRNYPKLLKGITDPPKVLYVRGELKKHEQCFGIVGTRLCSPYGKQIAMDIAGDLADAGLTIVSGLAPGIDTAAHTAVVEAGKRTIAVLGTGIDEKSIYPKENIQLSRKILENGGTLVSELPPGTPGSKITFPNRNRIISGLSLGTLVVEAKQKSGSLITANYTLRQKRKLFAVPGSIFSSNSKGPHSLLKRGAILAENAEDILEALGTDVTKDTKGAKATKGLQKVVAESDEERLILAALAEGALDIEKIIEKTKLPAAAVASAIALMELQNTVKNLGRNVYSSVVRNNSK